MKISDHLVLYRTKWSATVLAMQHITDRINALTERDGLSLTKLAEAAAMPRATLTRRLTDPATFTLGELERVAAVFATTADALVANGRAPKMRRGNAA